MPTDIKLYQMFGGEKVCEFWVLFFWFVCFFLGGGWINNCLKKKGILFITSRNYYQLARHCNTLLCFIIVIFVQWVLVQLLNFRLSLRKRRWQK